MRELVDNKDREFSQMKYSATVMEDTSLQMTHRVIPSPMLQMRPLNLNLFAPPTQLRPALPASQQMPSLMNDNQFMPRAQMIENSPLRRSMQIDESINDLSTQPIRMAATMIPSKRIQQAIKPIQFLVNQENLLDADQNEFDEHPELLGLPIVASLHQSQQIQPQQPTEKQQQSPRQQQKSISPLESTQSPAIQPVSAIILQNLINNTQARHMHLRSALEATRNFLRQQLPAATTSLNDRRVPIQQTPPAVESQMKGQNNSSQVSQAYGTAGTVGQNQETLPRQFNAAPPRVLRQLLASDNAANNVSSLVNARLYNFLFPTPNTETTTTTTTAAAATTNDAIHNAHSTNSSGPRSELTKGVETLDQSSSIIVNRNQTLRRGNMAHQQVQTRASEHRKGALSLSAPYEQDQMYGGKSVANENVNNTQNSGSLTAEASGHSLASISSQEAGDSMNGREQPLDQEQIVLISANDEHMPQGQEQSSAETMSGDNDTNDVFDHLATHWNSSISFQEDPGNGSSEQQQDESDVSVPQRQTKFYLAPAVDVNQSMANESPGAPNMQQQHFMLTSTGDAQLDEAAMLQLATEGDQNPDENNNAGNGTTNFFLVPAHANYEQQQQQQQNVDQQDQSSIQQQQQQQHQDQQSTTNSSQNQQQTQDTQTPTIQLPSQYDAVIRVPPEGHYDDYFKPSGGSDEQTSSLLNGQVHNNTNSNNNNNSSNHSTSNQQHQHYTLMPISEGHSSFVSASSNAQQQPLSTVITSDRDGNKQHVEYTMQYYMQQQQASSKQKEAQRLQQDQTVQFVPVIARDKDLINSTGSNTRHQETPSNGHQLQNGPTAHQHNYSAGDDLEFFIRHSNRSSPVSVVNNNNDNEDNIQVIVANSSPSNSQDPISEKLIHYTSEGKNFTRIASKPARHTFVNKDLNELPPEERQKDSNEISARSRSNASRAPQLFAAHYRQEASVGEQPRTEPLLRSTRSPSIIIQPAILSPSQGATEARFPHRDQTADHYQHQRQQQSSGPNRELDSNETEQNDDSSSSLSSILNENGEIELLPVDEMATRGQFGRYKSANPQQVDSARKKNRTHRSSGERMNQMLDRSSGPANHNNGNINGNSIRRPVKTSAERLAENGSANRGNHYQQRPAKATHHHQQHSARHHRHHQRPGATRRPQVTEARFSLKDLPLHAPTPMPTLAESAVSSISEVPMKAKRLKEHQVDKQELMNELLTALDRVKSAIYKLQPLTAKMNAIYRKSVTTNTRDIIMDHHKGTYAKRYPPGDYDDAYDRMHASELIERSRSRNSKAGASAKRRRSSGSQPRNNSTRASSESSVDQQTSGSATAAVYLPAPGELLELMAKNLGAKNSSQSDDLSKRLGELGPQVVSLASTTPVPVIIQASGVAVRQSPVQYDDDDNFDDDDANDVASSRGGSLLKRSSMQKLDDLNEQVDQSNSTSTSDEDEGPLFGYRITIYQAPENGSEDGSNSSSLDGDKDRELLSYRLIGSLGSDDAEGELTLAGPHIEAAASEQDLMLTSESSLVPTQSADGSTTTARPQKNQLLSKDKQARGSENTETYEYPFETRKDGDDDDQEDGDDDKDTSESQKKKKKYSTSKKHEKKSKKDEMEEGKEKKQHKKAKGELKGHKMHHEKGKKVQDEHKKKKEFKKIKHHKGVMSKESHKLHRDKHIKSHDRGAAKEKALKERTQIEFFEREQIVDDEFEKGKKSTIKAGWASGHDAKKSSKDSGGHGGQYSASEARPSFHLEPLASASEFSVTSASGVPLAKEASNQSMIMVASDDHMIGSASGVDKAFKHSTESSSGKQSNKFEKKSMEAKGKKFKGWREKGYKIITETEFIDRGSLHDSAYKKRDKGAAHHQKFKKHESKSEGHHGAMHEHHKKEHKQDEKKSKSEEKKKELMKEEKGKKAKKHKKGSKKLAKKEKKKVSEDHDYEESTVTTQSMDPSVKNMEETLSRRRLANMTGRPEQQLVPSSSTIKPQLLVAPSTSPPTTSTAPTFLRLAETDHHKPDTALAASSSTKKLIPSNQEASRYQYNLPNATTSTPPTTTTITIEGISTLEPNDHPTPMAVLETVADKKSNQHLRKPKLTANAIGAIGNSSSVSTQSSASPNINELRNKLQFKNDRPTLSGKMVTEKRLVPERASFVTNVHHQINQHSKSGQKSANTESFSINPRRHNEQQHTQATTSDLSSQVKLVRLALKHLNQNRVRQEQANAFADMNQPQLDQQQSTGIKFQSENMDLGLQQALLRGQTYFYPPSQNYVDFYAGSRFRSDDSQPIKGPWNLQPQQQQQQHLIKPIFGPIQNALQLEPVTNIRPQLGQPATQSIVPETSQQQIIPNNPEMLIQNQNIQQDSTMHFAAPRMGNEQSLEEVAFHDQQRQQSLGLISTPTETSANFQADSQYLHPLFSGTIFDE